MVYKNQNRTLQFIISLHKFLRNIDVRSNRKIETCKTKTLKRLSLSQFSKSKVKLVQYILACYLSLTLVGFSLFIVLLAFCVVYETN